MFATHAPSFAQLSGSCSTFCSIQGRLNGPFLAIVDILCCSRKQYQKLVHLSLLAHVAHLLALQVRFQVTCCTLACTIQRMRTPFWSMCMLDCSVLHTTEQDRTVQQNSRGLFFKSQTMQAVQMQACTAA